MHYCIVKMNLELLSVDFPYKLVWERVSFMGVAGYRKHGGKIAVSPLPLWARHGSVPGYLGLARQASSTKVVRRGQAGHFHALGRVLCTQLQQRMVLGAMEGTESA